MSIGIHLRYDARLIIAWTIVGPVCHALRHNEIVVADLLLEMLLGLMNDSINFQCRASLVLTEECVLGRIVASERLLFVPRSMEVLDHCDAVLGLCIVLMTAVRDFVDQDITGSILL